MDGPLWSWIIGLGTITVLLLIVCVLLVVALVIIIKKHPGYVLCHNLGRIDILIHSFNKLRLLFIVMPEKTLKHSTIIVTLLSRRALFPEVNMECDGYLEPCSSSRPGCESSITSDNPTENTYAEISNDLSRHKAEEGQAANCVNKTDNLQSVTEHRDVEKGNVKNN